MQITMLSDGNVMFEDARIIFRNFAGEEDMYNAKGSRNFCILIDDPVDAEQMKKDGWNVKDLKAREPGESDQPYLQISVGYKAFPPKIYIITGTATNDPKRTSLGEDEIEVLDWVDIQTVDVIIRPYRWTLKDGRTGIKAYVKSLFMTINEDALEQKYSDLEELPARAGRVDE